MKTFRFVVAMCATLLVGRVCAVEIVTKEGPVDAGTAAAPRYEANWASLDNRANPAWFDEAKIGIFIHWSVFSVPAIAWVYPDKPYGYGGHSCWYGMYVDRLRPLAQATEQARFEEFHRQNYGHVPFKALAPLFKAEAFDPQQWAALFKRSGARYAFLTSNFHDGYCLWPKVAICTWTFRPAPMAPSRCCNKNVWHKWATGCASMVRRFTGPNVGRSRTKARRSSRSIHGSIKPGNGP